MIVVNVVGFPYKLRLRNGNFLTVPNDNQPHEIPDYFAGDKFDNVFKILVPPRPNIVYNPVIVPIITREMPKAQEIIEINLGDNPPTEDKSNVDVVSVEEKKEEIKKPPLKGIRIKKGTRELLVKRGKPRNKVEETNANN